MGKEKEAFENENIGKDELTKRVEKVYKDLDEWAQKEKGYKTYEDWYSDHMD